MSLARVAVASLVLVAFGCGDDDGAADARGTDAAVFDAVVVDAFVADAAPPIAADYEGLWLITSMTVPSEDTLVTVERDGDPTSIRGDVVLDAIDADSLDGNVRQAQLEDGVQSTEVFTDDLQVSLEGATWVLEDTTGVTVFDAALTGDHLVLMLDALDPRTTSPSAPAIVVLDRVAPWSTHVVGAWDVVSLTSPSQGTVTLGECVELQAGVSWLTSDMTVEFTQRLLFERVLTNRRYSDSECMVMVEEQTSVQSGFAEEETETVLRIWAAEGDGVVYQAFTMSVVGDETTLTLTECLPAGCEAGAPTTVVVRPAP